MKKFIILGCGYLGTNIANYLASKSNTKVFVFGIENEYCEFLEENVVFLSKRIEQISDDDLEIFSGSIVIDAVGNINATNSSKNSSMIFLNNCESKINLIQKLNLLKIKKYIFLSSGGTVYEDSNLPHLEDDRLNPKNVYALEKVIIEDYLKIYGLENEGFSYLILRLSNPYGGIISKTKKQGIVDVVISKMKKNEPLELYGKLDNVRDYIYVNDVAESIYQIINSKYVNDVINIGSGRGTSLKEVIKIIEEKSGKEINIIVGKSTTQNIKCNVLNIGKLNRIVKDFNPISIEDGISLEIKKRI